MYRQFESGDTKHARKESLTYAISGTATAFGRLLPLTARASPQNPPQPCAATNAINTGVSPSSTARLSVSVHQAAKMHAGAEGVWSSK